MTNTNVDESPIATLIRAVDQFPAGTVVKIVSEEKCTIGERASTIVAETECGQELNTTGYNIQRRDVKPS